MYSLWLWVEEWTEEWRCWIKNISVLTKISLTHTYAHIHTRKQTRAPTRGIRTPPSLFRSLGRLLFNHGQQALRLYSLCRSMAHEETEDTVSYENMHIFICLVTIAISPFHSLHLPSPFLSRFNFVRKVWFPVSHAQVQIRTHRRT